MVVVGGGGKQSIVLPQSQTNTQNENYLLNLNLRIKNEKLVEKAATSHTYQVDLTA